MRSRRVRLPTSVALFQVCLPHRRLVYVAHDLPVVKARLARDAAAAIAARGVAVLVLTRADLDRGGRT